MQCAALTPTPAPHLARPERQKSVVAAERSCQRDNAMIYLTLSAYCERRRRFITILFTQRAALNFKCPLIDNSFPDCFFFFFSGAQRRRIDQNEKSNKFRLPRRVSVETGVATQQVTADIQRSAGSLSPCHPVNSNTMSACCSGRHNRKNVADDRTGTHKRTAPFPWIRKGVDSLGPADR